MRRSRLVTLALVLALALAAAGQPGARAATDNYVALGDSYAAGPIIPLQQKPWGCLKSDHNYAHLAAAGIGLPLRDATCSGAETDDMTQTQGVTPGPNPPQFDSLDASTKVVSITIGGNDIGFSSIAEDCFSATPTGSTPCQDKYVVDGHDTIADRIAETAPKVAGVLQGIHTRSPAARVFVVGYPAIFPEGPPTLCWPQLPVSWDDVPYLRDTQKRLNQMLADQAAANGSTYVDSYAASIGHDACQPPVLRWVEPAVPASPAAPVHPNLFGMQGMADALVASAQTP
jgi:lysophospholipase L1-like esterase